MSPPRSLRRRDVLALGGGVAVLASGRALGQGRAPVLGVLLSGPEGASSTSALLAALRLGLAEQGWQEPRNIVIEARFNVTDAPRAAATAAALLTLAPAAILTNTNIVTEEVLKLTRDVPVVFMAVGDPIDAGFVASYARPGGNATGFTDFEPTHAGKWLSFLREIAPGIRRVGLMFNPDTAPRNGWFYLNDFTLNALALAIEPLAMRVYDPEDIDGVVAVQAAVGDTGIIIAPDAFMMVNRGPVIAAIARHRVPAIYPFAEYAEEGGLMSYSIDMPDIFHRGGVYLGRILDGEPPADLPVQAPERFQLAVNLRTAAEQGVGVPLTLLATADRVIE